MGHVEYYEFLGVETSASEKEITKAFHKKSLLYHPDKNRDNPEAVEKFKRLNHIKTILCDPSKRAHYDRFGDVDMEEVESGDEPEAEEASDEEEEEMDAASLKELLNKIRGQNGSKFSFKSKMEELLQEREYQPSHPAPWTEETIKREWKAVTDASVTRVYWERKYIENLPSAMIKSNSVAKNLRIFALNVNKLTSLPETFAHFQALEELDLSTNQFEEFPEVLLKLSNLKVLNMERNQLKSLPPSLSSMTELTKISFFGNHLESVDDDCFSQLSNLREVDLECNHLRMIPQSLIDLQSSTENFILKTDDMSNLPPEPKKKSIGKRRRTKQKAPPKKRQRKV